MTSSARNEANRENAKKSTGPKTAAGKARSRFNGLVHGMRAEQVVLPHEDAAEFDAELQAWHEDWKPPTAARRALVERGAVAAWRLRRSVRVETERLTKLGFEAIAKYDAQVAATNVEAHRRLLTDPISALTLFSRSYEGVVEQAALWQGLADAAASPAGWDHIEDHHHRLFHLLGWTKRATHAEVGGVATVSWRLLASNHRDQLGDVEGFADSEVEAAAAGLRDFLLDEVRALNDSLAAYSTPESTRAHIADGASLDDSSAGKCLMRYEAQHDRSLRSAITQLVQLTRTGADLDAWEADAPTEPNEVASGSPVESSERDRGPKSYAERPIRSDIPAEAPSEPNSEPLMQVERDRGGRTWAVDEVSEGPTGLSNR